MGAAFLLTRHPISLEFVRTSITVRKVCLELSAKSAELRLDVLVQPTHITQLIGATMVHKLHRLDLPHDIMQTRLVSFLQRGNLLGVFIGPFFQCMEQMFQVTVELGLLVIPRL